MGGKGSGNSRGCVDMLPPQPKRPPGLLHLMCFRCGGAFTTATIERECTQCRIAGYQTYGTLHPCMEMGE